jgi:hypothetical protein
VTRRRAGLLLIAAGLLAFARGRAPLPPLAEFVWLVALAFAATAVWRLLERRAPLGVRIAAHAGFVLVAAATTGAMSGPAFLGGIALAFWLVYTTPQRGRPRTGWALIPAGALTTLATVAAVDELLPRWDEGIFFLLGMTATFTAVYLLPREAGGGRWALAPALVFAVLTVVANDPTGALARWAFPLALIGVGAAVLGWSRRRR